MDLTCRWEILLIGLWIRVMRLPGIVCQDAEGRQLAREDVLLLKDEDDPKCFSRTEDDLTCFFETPDNHTYELIYHTHDRTQSCAMWVQRTDEGTFLHVCYFPESDIFLFAATHIEVVDSRSDTTLYQRNVFVEDQVLLDRPVNVSLRHTGEAAQLHVTWYTHGAKRWENTVSYRIWYSSKLLGEKTLEGKGMQAHKLVSLVPGEEVQVQVQVKHSFSEEAGHWSHWSDPVLATVPQSADDISLICYTSHLQNITCQWDGNKYEALTYTLFYKTDVSKASGWTECQPDWKWTDLCRFHGDESRLMRVKLVEASAPAPLSRTFYSEPFNLNSSIKPPPPGHVRAAVHREKLCLAWEAPLQALLAHLQYELGYQGREDGAWMTLSLKGPETEACLELPTGSRYRAKVRAKPNGSVYSGHWSEWSHVLSGDVPADIGALLILFIPVVMLILAIALISLFPTYLRKLKLHLWPPVPNLDKVLQSFLTDFSRQRWDPSSTVKQCPEETTTVVEVTSEAEAPGPGKPQHGSSQQLPEDGGREQVDGSVGVQPEVHPDYVILNKDRVVLCPEENTYVYEEDGDGGDQEMRAELLQATARSSCSDDSAGIPSCPCSDFLNQSYSPLAEPVDRRDGEDSAAQDTGNLYTDFPP
ncbi:thrombopoietin receptor [Genypterus blacodes]|uniref:thrombopoietin receptor n=1 Tax=Genypterus blacodes TaxID=154954 RepID=UPI003F75BAFC